MQFRVGAIPPHLIHWLQAIFSFLTDIYFVYSHYYEIMIILNNIYTGNRYVTANRDGILIDVRLHSFYNFLMERFLLAEITKKT